MNRRAALGLLAALAGPTILSGCQTDGEWTVEKVLGWDEPPNVRKTPKAPPVRPASIAVAQRVEELGRRIVAQNTFTGLDPLFHTVGVPEVVLFHRGTAELFVSEGLVAKCPTDGELAAVLCSELGVMMAEKRAAAANGRDADAVRDVAATGDAGTAVGRLERKFPGPADAPVDARELTKQLLRGAGFEPTDLDKVGPLLKQSTRGDVIRTQMAGPATAPTWEK